jgi:hypothetical protein
VIIGYSAFFVGQQKEHDGICGAQKIPQPVNITGLIIDKLASKELLVQSWRLF